MLLDETAFVTARLRAFNAMESASGAAGDGAATGQDCSSCSSRSSGAGGDFMSRLLRTQHFSVHITELPQPRFAVGGHTKQSLRLGSLHA